MHKVKIFLNSRASASGKSAPWIEKIRRMLFRSSLEILETTSLENLQFELDRAVSDKADLVISVGGDGTANTLIQHLGRTQTAFLIIPFGTANDLAHELKIVGRIEEAIHSVRATKPHQIDLVQVNGRLMATNGGIGLAADVAERVNQYRDSMPLFKGVMRLSRARIYSVMLGTELLLPRVPRFDVEIECNEFSRKLSTPIVMVNNQPVVGKVFRVAPLTKNNDGHFNLTVFTHKRRLDLLRCIGRIRTNKDVTTDPELIVIETANLNLKLSRPQLFYGDGEVFERNSVFTIRALPLALNVYGGLDP